MNKIILSGNVVKENELVNGVVKNTIAVRRDYKNSNGEYETDFFDIVAFNNCANYLSNYVNKGDKIELSGRMQIKMYQSQDGINRKFYEVIVDSVATLSKAQVKDQDSQPIKETDVIDDSDELPF